jgi:hypothetical protein
VLRHIDLSENGLEGAIPASICQLKILKYLYLKRNKLQGSLPDPIGEMSALQVRRGGGRWGAGGEPVESR